MKTNFFALTILLLFLQSCGIGTTPENYFDRTALNTNLFSGFGAEDFENYLAAKSQNSLYTELENKEWVLQDKLEPHIKTFIIPKLEESMEKVEALSKTSRTEKMIEASLKLHQFTLEKYNTDYITIAKLIDADAPESEITEAIIKFNDENYEKYWDLHTKLMDVALPYAEANNIDVSRY